MMTTINFHLSKHFCSRCSCSDGPFHNFTSAPDVQCNNSIRWNSWVFPRN